MLAPMLVPAMAFVATAASDSTAPAMHFEPPVLIGQRQTSTVTDQNVLENTAGMPSLNTTPGDGRGGAPHPCALEMVLPFSFKYNITLNIDKTTYHHGNHEGHHYFWPNGLVSLGGGRGLGQAAGSSFYSTIDNGANWNLTILDAKGGGPDAVTEATILSKDGSTLHNFGSVEATANKSVAYTTFNSTTALFFSYSSTNSTFAVEQKDAPITFRGLPTPSKVFRTDGRGYVRLKDSSLIISIILDWGIVVYASTDDGFTWDYLSTVLAAATVPHSEEGPNENDLALIEDEDGQTILCVIRLDGGDGKPDHYMLPYVKTVSTDTGRTWSKPVSLLDTRGEIMGCARPRLLGLTGGGVVLSGGRLNKTNHDNMLWVNAAGDGVAWDAISISYVHNMLEKNSTFKFGPSVNNSGARISTSYTSLVKTGAHSGYVVYSRLLPSPSVAFALRFTLD